MTDHEHRPGTYREGADRKVVRCKGCFEVLEEVEAGTAPAPAPEPVDVTREAEVTAPQPEPVPGPADEHKDDEEEEEPRRAKRASKT